ncbi:MAG: hypothetical protein AB7F89_02570 [Pirellulaceae bacterium]
MRPACSRAACSPGLFVAACLVGLAGCQTLDANLGTLLGDTRAETPRSVTPDPGTPTYYIEFQPYQKKPILVAMPLNGVLYVQDALEQSGALKKFRRSQIEVFRQLPQGGGHKIPVKFDRGKRRVDPGSDYSVHPNDRIVVTEDTSTILDDMLQSLGATGTSLK